MAKPFKIRSAIICDDVRAEVNGKDLCIGVYNGVIVVGGFPTTVRRLFCRIELELNSSGPHSVSLEVFDPSKNRIINVNGEMTMDNPQEPGSIALGVGPLHFVTPGTYTIQFGIGGTKQVINKFIVRTGDQQPAKP